MLFYVFRLSGKLFNYSSKTMVLLRDFLEENTNSTGKVSYPESEKTIKTRSRLITSLFDDFIKETNYFEDFSSSLVGLELLVVTEDQGKVTFYKFQFDYSATFKDTYFYNVYITEIGHIPVSLQFSNA